MTIHRFMPNCCCGCVEFVDRFGVDASPPPSPWVVSSGTWAATGGVLSTSGAARLYRDGTATRTYFLEADVVFSGEWFLRLGSHQIHFDAATQIARIRNSAGTNLHYGVTHPSVGSGRLKVMRTHQGANSDGEMVAHIAVEINGDIVCVYQVNAAPSPFTRIEIECVSGTLTVDNLHWERGYSVDAGDATCTKWVGGHYPVASINRARGLVPPRTLALTLDGNVPWGSGGACADCATLDGVYTLDLEWEATPTQAKERSIWAGGGVGYVASVFAEYTTAATPNVCGVSSVYVMFGKINAPVGSLGYEWVIEVEWRDGGGNRISGCWLAAEITTTLLTSEGEMLHAQGDWTATLITDAEGSAFGVVGCEEPINNGGVISW